MTKGLGSDSKVKETVGGWYVKTQHLLGRSSFFVSKDRLEGQLRPRVSGPSKVEPDRDYPLVPVLVETCC